MCSLIGEPGTEGEEEDGTTEGLRPLGPPGDLRRSAQDRLAEEGAGAGTAEGDEGCAIEGGSESIVVVVVVGERGERGMRIGDE